MKKEPVKPLKLCRVCKKNYCLSGYCQFCREKDERAATIEAREETGRKAVPPVPQYTEYTTETLPYCCPVCGGNGLVPNGFYRQTGGNWVSSDSTPEQCKTCNGTGVVWKK